MARKETVKGEKCSWNIQRIRILTDLIEHLTGKIKNEYRGASQMSRLETAPRWENMETTAALAAGQMRASLLEKKTLENSERKTKNWWIKMESNPKKKKKREHIPFII